MKYLFKKDAEGKSVLSKLFNNNYTQSDTTQDVRAQIRKELKKMATLKPSSLSNCFSSPYAEKAARGLIFCITPIYVPCYFAANRAEDVLYGIEQHKQDVSQNNNGPNLNKM